MRCVDGFTHQRSGGTDTGGCMETEQAVNSMCAGLEINVGSLAIV